MSSEDTETFDVFLKKWKAKNIVPLDSRSIDRGDREYIIKRLASELTQIAWERAWSSAFAEITHPYGDAVAYVRALVQRAEAGRKEAAPWQRNLPKTVPPV
jgi:hypothetical protein